MTATRNTTFDRSKYNIHFHSGDLGDLIYYLGAMRELQYYTGKKNILVIINAFHGQREMFSPARFQFIYPLLQQQDYIEEIFNDYFDPRIPPYQTGDLTSEGVRDLLRSSLSAATQSTVLNIGPLSLHPSKVNLYVWCLLYFQSKGYDLPALHNTFVEPWLKVKTIGTFFPYQTYFVVARSFRYRNPAIQSWYTNDFLHDPFSGRCVFLGTREEYEDATRNHLHASVKFASVSNALQMALYIAKAQFVVANQSFPLSLAVGLGKNVLLEQSPVSPDCDFKYPNGGSDFFSCEHYGSFKNAYIAFCQVLL